MRYVEQEDWGRVYDHVANVHWYIRLSSSPFPGRKSFTVRRIDWRCCKIAAAAGNRANHSFHRVSLSSLGTSLWLCWHLRSGMFSPPQVALIHCLDT
jgi:hypothetical protein